MMEDQTEVQRNRGGFFIEGTAEKQRSCRSIFAVKQKGYSRV